MIFKPLSQEDFQKKRKEKKGRLVRIPISSVKKLEELMDYYDMPSTALLTQLIDTQYDFVMLKGQIHDDISLL